MPSGNSQIPGLSHLTAKGSLSDLRDTILLLKGAPGSGKSVYCRLFIADGLHEGVKCVYLNSSLTDKQFRNLFSDSHVAANNLKFVNPYLRKSLSVGSSGSGQMDSQMDPKLAQSLQEIRDPLSEWGSDTDTTKENNQEDLSRVYFVIDSLTH
ncbi:MAG TPA: hypothetical protein VFI64_04870, partial [Nitrososphaeraceae archaeon]|nr:hypothetical protein [Nitrososphaeraceae archaeon]